MSHRPKDRIRLGMVGGGQGAFIGAVHRFAARMDDKYELVAGALSGNPDRALESAKELRIALDRSYDDYRPMAEKESQLADGIEVVSIVTPNHLHFPVAQTFLKAGIHVICDKPLVSSTHEAQVLQALVFEKDLLFGVTYNYSGYPAMRQAKQMVAAGELGDIRVIQVEYPQEWLTEKLEDGGQKQALWRTDPKQSGGGGCVGDIGTHAYHLACFVSGLEAESLLAELTTFVEGRLVDDNAHIMLRFKGGARGMLWASQVAPGNENGLRLRVYGSRGGLQWEQENPNRLWFTRLGEPTQLITRAGAGASAAANRVSRIPQGHPEGYLEAFANIYSEFAEAVVARRTGAAPEADVEFPTILDGARGVAFVAAALQSSREGGIWVDMADHLTPGINIS